MGKTVRAEHAWVYRARAATLVLAMVFSSTPVLGQGTGGAAPPEGSASAEEGYLRRDVTLVDQALRLRVARADLTAADADAELTRRARELTARKSETAPAPELLAEHRREAAAFFAHVEQAIRSALSWPADQPSEEYETQAIGQLERARGDYREALRENKDPRDALRLAQQVLAWTRGEADVPGDRDVFAGGEDRVTVALQAGTAGGPPPSEPPPVVGRVDANPPSTDPPSSSPPGERGTPPASVAQPPPAAPGAGTALPENSPTYVPKDEALAHKRKADEAADVETALKEYQEALRIEPRYAPWWSHLGEVLGEHSRWQEAEAAFSRAVELNPGEPEYRANLALALLRLGRREEAVTHGKAARDLAREQKNDLHATHPVYAELSLPEDSPPRAEVPSGETAPRAEAPTAPQRSYRGLKFCVAGVKRVKEHEGARADPGREIVVVTTAIDRSAFESDSRGSECRLDRAKLYDADGNAYASTEQQRRVTAQLRAEDGRMVGDPQLSHDWSFDVPEGARVKTFKFVFADERVYTGGQDPDENVTDLSFDVE